MSLWLLVSCCPVRTVARMLGMGEACAGLVQPGEWDAPTKPLQNPALPAGCSCVGVVAFVLLSALRRRHRQGGAPLEGRGCARWRGHPAGLQLALKRMKKGGPVSWLVSGRVAAPCVDHETIVRWWSLFLLAGTGAVVWCFCGAVRRTWWREGLQAIGSKTGVAARRVSVQWRPGRPCGSLAATWVAFTRWGEAAAYMRRGHGEEGPAVVSQSGGGPDCRLLVSVGRALACKGMAAPRGACIAHVLQRGAGGGVAGELLGWWLRVDEAV